MSLSFMLKSSLKLMRTMILVLGVLIVGNVQADLTPTMPIANVDTSDLDYTMGSKRLRDNITGLEWQRVDDGIERTWEEAWEYCADLSLGSHDDWRLPTITELISIVDYGATAWPYIDQIAFPNTSYNYWSATTDANDGDEAWYVLFFNGNYHNLTKDTEFYVRCVAVKPY